ncbi:hypothetical protein [Alistipes sp.]|uniref:hypothetical protein n=1 Tax=Alistipes sp. TaxID=1872444 RepID=UPI003AF149C2
MKVHEILRQHADLLRTLARAGVAIEDVRYIPLWRDYDRLRHDGFKIAYIVAYLCDTYEISERTVYRIVGRFNRNIPSNC